MNLNHFQQAEIDSHKDAELLWIIQSSIESFKENKSNFAEDGKFQRFELYKKVGIDIAGAIASREGFEDKLHKLTERESANCLCNSFKEKYPGENAGQEWNHWDELVVPFLDTLIYESLMRVRVPLVERETVNDYWPFGQEGGFCNPMKLKMLEDD